MIKQYNILFLYRLSLLTEIKFLFVFVFLFSFSPYVVKGQDPCGANKILNGTFYNNIAGWTVSPYNSWEHGYRRDIWVDDSGESVAASNSMSLCQNTPKLIKFRFNQRGNVDAFLVVKLGGSQVFKWDSTDGIETPTGVELDKSGSEYTLTVNYYTGTSSGKLEFIAQISSGNWAWQYRIISIDNVEVYEVKPQRPPNPTASEIKACDGAVANLNTVLPTSPPSPGSVYEWHTVDSNPSAATLVSNPKDVEEDVYYLFAHSQCSSAESACEYSDAAFGAVKVDDCEVEQTLEIEKEYKPVPGVCNTFNVTLTAKGLEVERPIEAILVIDVSGSMDGEITEGQPLLGLTKNAAIEFVKKAFSAENNPTGLNRVGIVSYSNFGTLAKPLTLSTGKQSLIDVINSLTAGGGTNISHGIDLAKEEMNTRGTHNCETVRSIVVMTDGIATVHGSGGASCYLEYGGTAYNYYDNYPQEMNDCTNAAVASGQAAQSYTDSDGKDYETAVFSVAVTGGIDSEGQNVKIDADEYGNLYLVQGDAATTAQAKSIASQTMNAIQNKGLFESEDGSNISEIYGEIFQELIVAASAAGEGGSFLKDHVSPNFKLIPSSVQASEGEVEIEGEEDVINWKLPNISKGEAVSITYQVEIANFKCGQNNAGNSEVSYVNPNCEVVEKLLPNPDYCVPCTEGNMVTELSPVEDNGCVKELKYEGQIATTDGCDNVTTTMKYHWAFYKDYKGEGDIPFKTVPETGDYVVREGETPQEEWIKGVIEMDTSFGTGVLRAALVARIEFDDGSCIDIESEYAYNEVRIEDIEKPQILKCPEAIDLVGCSVSVITPTSASLAFSDEKKVITQEAFENAGAEATDNCAVAEYAYIDKASGDCPIIVERTFFVSDYSENTVSCTQTITINRVDFQAELQDKIVKVNCPDEALVEPTPPTVQDACGTNIVPTMTSPQTIDCNGDMVWTFTYTDACSGNSGEWHHIYQIERPDFSISKENETENVQCIAKVVEPTTPPVVQDFCGKSIIPSKKITDKDGNEIANFEVFKENTASYIGSITFAYTYIDCANHSHVWKKVFTVEGLKNPSFTQVGPICSGESFSLPSSSTNGISGTWSPAINNTATTEYTFTPDAGQCATTATMTITVHPKPSVDIVSNNDPICLGDVAKFTVNASNSAIGGTLKYQIGVYPAATVLIEGEVSYFETTSTQTGDLSLNLLSIETKEGCEYSLSNISTVVVNALPNNTSSGFSGSAICQGEQATLKFDAEDATFSTPYTIKYTDGTTTWTETINSASEETFNVEVNPVSPGLYDYSLVSIVNGDGCERSSGFKKSTARVIVRAKPSVAVNASTNAVCVDDTSPKLTFSNADVKPIIVTYNINNGDDQSIEVGGTDSEEINVQTAVAGVYNYNVTSVRYKSTPSCDESVSINKCVTVFPNNDTAPTVSTPNNTAIVVTAPQAFGDFNIEYSFDDGATWGANIPPTADNCDGYKVKTRYVLAKSCGSLQVGSTISCAESPAATRILDTTPPTFTAINKEFCVENILQAAFDGVNDITPNRPDYYLFTKGSTVLDIADIDDNCCDDNDMNISWQINFDGGVPVAINGVGQPSSYSSDIQFPGDGVSFSNKIHTITYRLTDCNGNHTEKTINITIKPRPKIEKVNN